MTSRAAVNEFLSQRTLALVGASRGGKKFGNVALRGLVANGYRVIPVHPEAVAIEGIPCAPSLATLPERVGGVVTVVPPAQTEKVVRDARAAGISRVWMQQGAESPAALRYCEEHGLTAIHGECVLMFLDRGSWFHRLHRAIRGLFGRLPR